MSDRRELVSGIPLFAKLSDAQRESIERLFFHVERSDGDTVIAEGDDSPVNFYVITQGEAVVSMNGSEVRRLRSGDFFGETALANNGSRSATVTAVGQLEMLAISGWNFSQLLATDSGIRDTVSQAVTEYAEADAGRVGHEAQGAH